MEKTYWLDRWEHNDIGFHQADVNAYLSKYWSELQLTHGSKVFVPLCGKSRDMLWLNEQGHGVLGIELSKLAVQAFFHENEYTPQHETNDKFEIFSINNLSILCGNFLELGKNDLATVSAVYDRASLVALPPEMRERYVKHLMSILPPNTQILLITFDYPQSEMAGPPFAVSPDEVKRHYQQHADIRLLTQLDVLEQNPRFQERGLSRIQESVFLLTTHSI
ncbi:MAG: thiopurine S-methyltransferase [Nitrosomonas sp.]|nr:thiopurine S-methyltransferase [Nitrosomonas sp.]